MALSLHYKIRMFTRTHWNNNVVNVSLNLIVITNCNFRFDEILTLSLKVIIRKARKEDLSDEMH